MRETSRVFLSALLIAAGCNGAASVSGEPAPVDQGRGLSWQEFLGVVYQEPGTGVYIVDGDTPIEDVKQLREFWELHVRQGQLIVDTVNGQDDRWNDAQKLNLTYCVSPTFGTRYATVLQAMEDATGAWMAVANVKFVHLAAQDDTCTASNANVVFDVRPVDSRGQYAARSFFPTQSRSSRNVLIDASAFQYSSPSLTGILRHEIGHTLGFRHEHTRPEARACFEDYEWRALTPYDSASVMHYPQCNGTAGWNLLLTDRDAAGAALLYGAPGATPPKPTVSMLDAAAALRAFNGTVAQGASQAFGPIAVTPGSLLDVQMTGTGDPDLYVRFGSAPTTTAYACRPYLSGAVERCAIDVPSNQSSAYLLVRGYAAGTFGVSASFTAR